MTASVPVSAIPTPVQVMQLAEETAPPPSNDALDPAGGKSSIRSALSKPDEAPERVTVIEVVPPVPAKLYQASMLRAGLARKTWQVGHCVHPEFVTEQETPLHTPVIVTSLPVLTITTCTDPAVVGIMLPLESAIVQTLAPVAQVPPAVVMLSCRKVQPVAELIEFTVSVAALLVAEPAALLD